MKSKLNDRIREIYINSAKKRFDEMENPIGIIGSKSYLKICIGALKGCKELEDYYNQKLKSIISLN